MDAFIADDGESIDLRISGDGPPLIFLHGWTVDHRAWNPFVAPLAATHRVYWWNARGHGPHALRTASVVDVQRMARDLANLIDHYGLEDAVVVGHSMGALTLWQYIRDFGSDRLARLCVIDQTPKLVTDPEWSLGVYGDFDAARAASFRRDLDQDFAESVLRLVAFGRNAADREAYEKDVPNIQKRRRWLQTLDPAPVVRCWESLTAADYRDVLPAIDLPTLLIYGEHSNFYDGEVGLYVAAHIRQSTLHVYPRADHSPHFCDPVRFLRDLREFST